MPMPATNGRLGADITKEAATEWIWREVEYLAVTPEAAAMQLMRCVDSWEEHSAIIKALDEFIAKH